MARRGVHEPPGIATRGIIGWALNMWPYVNGKALMSNIRLGDTEAGEMLDILHFLMEDDLHVTSMESAESRSGIRVSLYRDFYNVKYEYEYKPKKNSRPGSHSDMPNYMTPDSMSGLEYMTEAEEARPFEPRETELPMKPPAQPLTEFDPYAANPFEGILDAPMN